MVCASIVPRRPVYEPSALTTNDAPIAVERRPPSDPDMSRRAAIITGVSGQDGSYIAELLNRKGYRVVGTSRDPTVARCFVPDFVELREWNLRDEQVFRDLIGMIRPVEIYNFAAYSSGAAMFDEPVRIGDINGLTVTRILEAIWTVLPSTRLLQASSSEMYGQPHESPQSERTTFNPGSPYAAAKLYGHGMIDIYRRRYGVFACSAILFNHESPRRGVGFITRRVAQAAAKIKLGLAKFCQSETWMRAGTGEFAGDFVEGAWRMLQANEPEDYVFASGTTHSVRDLCDIAFSHVGLDYRAYVRQDPGQTRNFDTVALVGDASKAAQRLKWRPTITFREMMHSMVDADLAGLINQKGRSE